MSRRTDKDFLCDISEAVNRTTNYVNNVTYEKFVDDIKTQDAVVRNIEIIGEAAKNISNKIKDKYAIIPWKSLAGMRDKLIHQYFGVNIDIVWHVVKEELPEIIFQIDEIIEKEKM
jgi:uncharacterized protein with HEPN domain